jgi:hypothetical protein
MKFSFLFLFFILSISVCSCATLSMSPPQVDFQGNTGEKICSEFNIDVDGNYLLLGEDRWAIEGYAERKLSKHNLDSAELGLTLFYPREITLENKTYLEVCIEGKKPGNFHGILLYGIKDKPIKVGIWMEVQLEGFTLESVNIFQEGFSEEKKLGLMFVPGLLIVILLVLLLVKRKGRNGFGR